MENKKILNMEELEQVSAGTFTANLFGEEEYNKYKIKTKYHFFAKDEFQLPNSDKWVNEKEANAYINQVDPEFYKKRIKELMDMVEHPEVF